jgi:hypothetical protein
MNKVMLGVILVSSLSGCLGEVEAVSGCCIFDGVPGGDESCGGEAERLACIDNPHGEWMPNSDD